MGRLEAFKLWMAAEIIDLGVPKDEVSPEDMRRIRIISITTLALCMAAGVPAALQFVRLGMPGMISLILATIVLAIGNLLLLRARRDPHVSSHVGVGLLASLLLTSNVMTGGFYNPNFAWLYVIPLTAAAVINLRSAAIWTALVMCVSVAFWLLPDFGIVLVNQVPEAAREGNAIFNRISAIFAIGVIGSSFVMGQRRAEMQLASANHDVLAESAYVQLLMHGAVASNEASSFESAMQDSMHRICETMNWKAGHIYSVNDDGWILTSGIRHSRGRALSRLEKAAGSLTFRVGEGLVGLAVSERRPQIRVSFGTSDDPESAAAIARSSGIRSAIAVPIFVGSEIPAVMLFAVATELHDSQRLREVFSLIGMQLGRVAEREALQERMQQVQKMEAVGQLAAGIAHEINNPMSYVRSNLHVLRQDWDALRKTLSVEDEAAVGATFDSCEELIDESLEGVERTIEIVRDVREFSHKGPVDKAQWETVPLAGLMEDALRVIAARAPAGVSTESRHDESARCHCAPNQLRQVFVNLILNAIQAVGDAGHILLETGSDGDCVFARVEDDGSGMRETTRERLFDPFFTTKPVGEGTGLGLSVSYEIVRRHAGEIFVSSELNAGTCFEVRLPTEA